jgi:predicted lipoprotein with Yx(FWY)xxD motif
MQRNAFPRLVLVTMLATGAGVATEVATASASAPGRHATKVAAKKKAKVTIKLATTSLGKILVAANGKTLYAFDSDGTSITSAKCSGGCTSVWPPLKGKGKLKAGKGLDASLLKLGGGKQVAYNGHLLYEFVGKAAGDTSGQGIGGFHVVGADGNPIK